MIKSIKAMCAYRKRVTCKEFTMTIDGLNPIQGQQSSVQTERMRGQQQTPSRFGILHLQLRREREQH